jgi:L-asparaginase II
MPCVLAEQDLPRHVPLAVVTRGGHIESVHYGSVAVCDGAGRLVASAGDPGAAMFTRSALKPFQAMPLIADGGATALGWTARELALACASHNGDEAHAALADRMLRSAGFAADDLRCGVHVPVRYTFFDRTPPADATWSALHHNCSGKHAAMLAWCRLHDADPATYLEFAHPLQCAIRAAVAWFCGISETELKHGVDGCSAPNYAVPLASLARAYARLARAQADDRYGHAPQDLFAAMSTHPELVSGEGRNDLVLSRAGRGDWVAKVGADGVQAIGVRSRALGIAIKVSDGSFKALHPVSVSVLAQLGLLDADAEAVVAELARAPVTNVVGLETGRIEPVVRID